MKKTHWTCPECGHEFVSGSNYCYRCKNLAYVTPQFGAIGMHIGVNHASSGFGEIVKGLLGLLIGTALDMKLHEMHSRNH